MWLVAAFVLTLVLLVAWFAQLLGLPGTWLIVVAVAAYAWFVSPEKPASIGWNVVIALAALAVVGELAELAAGAMGVSKAGGSRRGALLAIVGSIVGSIVGMCVGVPVPLVGSLVAAVAFGALGALLGAMIGEQWKGRDFDASLEVGKAAFVGRVLGTVAKMTVCSIMVVVTLGALIL
jgi:uncharacterized protein